MLSLSSRVFQDAYGGCSLNLLKDPWWTNFIILRWTQEMMLLKKVRSDALWHWIFSENQILRGNKSFTRTSANQVLKFGKCHLRCPSSLPHHTPLQNLFLPILSVSSFLPLLTACSQENHLYLHMNLNYCSLFFSCRCVFKPHLWL